MQAIEIPFPETVKKFALIFKFHGHELYAVGGVIRDILIANFTPDYNFNNIYQTSTYDDIDFATSASPEEVMQMFPKTIPTGLKHGTVTVLFKKKSFEVTTYRIDAEYKNHRSPEHIIFTKSLHEDLSRRDFTINAMASNPLEGNIIDIFNGIEDIKKKIIRCVGNPYTRYEEDALRMLRAIRFATKLNYKIEMQSMEAIHALKDTIRYISQERKAVEFRKILCSRYPSKGIELLKNTKLLSYIFTDHAPSSLEHRMQALDILTQFTTSDMNSIEEYYRFAITLGFIDIYTPHKLVLSVLCKQIAEYAHNNLKNLKYSHKTINEVSTLISAQQYLKLKDNKVTVGMNQFKLTVLLSRYGIEMTQHILQFLQKQLAMYQHFHPLLDITEAHSKLIAAFELTRNDDFLTHIILDKKLMAIDGNTLLNTFDLRAGKWLGNLIATLHRHVMKHPETNTKAQLLTLAMEKMNKGTSGI